jgi:hypothetical protein
MNLAARLQSDRRLDLTQSQETRLLQQRVTGMRIDVASGLKFNESLKSSKQTYPIDQSVNILGCWM